MNRINKYVRNYYRKSSFKCILNNSNSLNSNNVKLLCFNWRWKLTFLKWLKVSGLFSHISVISVTPVISTPEKIYFFSEKGYFGKKISTAIFFGWDDNEEFMVKILTRPVLGTVSKKWKKCNKLFFVYRKISRVKKNSA